MTSSDDDMQARANQAAADVREYIGTIAKHPDCVGVLVQCSSVGRHNGCEIQDHVIPIAEALRNPPIPCAQMPWCFGIVTGVFSDEMP